MPALLCAILAGCREELGPISFSTTRVDGVVREGGRVVGGGWIEFVPIDGTIGNLRSAQVAADGRFEATDVPVGRVLIGLVDAPIHLPGGRRLFHPQESPIRLVIPPGPSCTIEIDLLAEAMRHEELSRRKAAETPP